MSGFLSGLRVGTIGIGLNSSSHGNFDSECVSEMLY